MELAGKQVSRGALNSGAITRVSVKKKKKKIELVTLVSLESGKMMTMIAEGDCITS